MKLLVLKQPGMPQSPGCEEMLAELAKKAELVIANTEEIRSGAATGEYFYNAHGAYYPIELEDALFDFFAQGGGLLHIGGMPFDKAMTCENGEWHEVVRTLGDLQQPRRLGPSCPCRWTFFALRLGLTPYSPALSGRCLWTGSSHLTGSLWAMSNADAAVCRSAV